MSKVFGRIAGALLDKRNPADHSNDRKVSSKLEDAASEERKRKRRAEEAKAGATSVWNNQSDKKGVTSKHGPENARVNGYKGSPDTRPDRPSTLSGHPFQSTPLQRKPHKPHITLHFDETPQAKVETPYVSTLDPRNNQPPPNPSLGPVHTPNPTTGARKPDTFCDSDSEVSTESVEVCSSSPTQTMNSLLTF